MARVAFPFRYLKVLPEEHHFNFFLRFQIKTTKLGRLVVSGYLEIKWKMLWRNRNELNK